MAEIGQEGGILFDPVANGGSSARTERLEPGNRCRAAPPPRRRHLSSATSMSVPFPIPTLDAARGEKFAPTFMVFGYCLVT